MCHLPFLMCHVTYPDYSYVPGWDCHGLPIENKVLKQLGVSLCRFGHVDQAETSKERCSRTVSVSHSSRSRGVRQSRGSQPATTIPSTWYHGRLDSRVDLPDPRFVLDPLGQIHRSYDLEIDHDYEIRQLRVFQQMVQNGKHIHRIPFTRN